MAQNSFKPGNKLSEKHGGSAAIRALSKGEPFAGLAAERLVELTREYQERGPLSLIETDALRLQTAADLFYSAFLGAAEAGDLDRMTLMINKFGWLVNSAIRALVAIKTLQGRADREPVDLSAYRDGDGSGDGEGSGDHGAL